ncbi:glycosyltransferase family 4 protein [Aliarcobacter butzleri]|uniref:glycosyltransferase family 4 protein n=1 Tax=Aliarcobacter butzleri TaxID=28197 RepID=UPI00263DCCDE|nr:glycosyltransferase family 4 protein [Aliarcobacter butzleri]MDN5091641.1 glycosyltransferase family 4 protein [Aliarcobacter butzleri]
MKLKSIVLTTGIFPPDIGGPASFIPILAQKLSQKNITVTVITLSDKIEDDANLPYKVIRINRNIKKPFRDIIVIKEIVKASKKSDLIFSNTLAFESVIASIISRKKILQKIVGDIAWERANTSGRFKGNLEDYQKGNLDLKSKFTNIYRNFAVKYSDMIITPSFYLKNIVTNWNYPEDKIKVIYNAVQFEESNNVIEKKKYRIISVARLIPLKGIEMILKVLGKLDFDFEYVIVGDGKLKNKLEQIAKEFSVNTIFTGNLSKIEVANWLNSSDLFIQNSVHETMPHVILESMENNCPVLASSVGGTPEVVHNLFNGLLFNHNDENELLEKIYLIKNDNKLREKLISNGRKFTKEFADIDKMVEKYIEIIEGMI